MRALPFVFLAGLAGPALAQDAGPGRSVTADLDGDGRPETYSLVDTGSDTVDLVIESPEGEARVPNAAWSGTMAGQEPGLALSPAGSVLLTSGNDSIGRNRWRLTLTLAHRDGEPRVAGITYDWHDTLEPETAWGGCDVNLLSGRGVITGPAGESALRAPRPAPKIGEWTETALPEFLPVECFGG